MVLLLIFTHSSIQLGSTTFGVHIFLGALDTQTLSRSCSCGGSYVYMEEVRCWLFLYLTRTATKLFIDSSYISQSQQHLPFFQCPRVSRCSVGGRDNGFIVGINQPRGALLLYYTRVELFKTIFALEFLKKNHHTRYTLTATDYTNVNVTDAERESAIYFVVARPSSTIDRVVVE